MSYDGGKGGAGVYQSIINLMPPHKIFVSAFLGHCAVLRNKRPAEQNIGIELNEAALALWHGDEVPNLKLIHGDSLTVLPEYARQRFLTKESLVFCDPPYLLSTRRQHRPIYRCEMSSEDEHTALLEVLMNLPCMVMLSGYPSDLYERAIGHWRRAEFYTSDRGGNRKLECVWMNYPEPLELHDYRFLGRGFRERERIKRKRARWRARLEKMPALERHALMATIEELRLKT
jgi:DNA adenine methylase